MVRVWIDGIVGSILKGWAIDESDGSKVISLMVYCDGEMLGHVIADCMRMDLKNKKISDGYSGFQFPLPPRALDGCEHTFRVVPRDDTLYQGRYELLICSPRYSFGAQEEKPWVSFTAPGTALEIERLVQGTTLESLPNTFSEVRNIMLSNRRMFMHDFGLVEKVRELVKVKSFEEIMRVRYREWYGNAPCKRQDCCKLTGSECHIWQAKLEKKENMQRFAESLGLRTPKQIYKFDEPERIVDLQLPHNYVAKPDGFGAGKGVYVVSNQRNLINGQHIDPSDISLEWSKLKTRKPSCSFLVEEFIIDEFARYLPVDRPVIPIDYKVYVFGGVATLISVFDRNEPGPGRADYSVHWDRAEAPINTTYPVAPDFNKPEFLKEIVESAEKIGRNAGVFCRVDFYSSADGPVFGEITLLPANGKNFSDYGETLLLQSAMLLEDELFWRAPPFGREGEIS